MEIAANDNTLGGEKLVQSIDSERIPSTYSDQDLATVDANYVHHTPHDTTQISTNNDISSCTPHYIPENNLNEIVESEQMEIQHFYSYEQQKAIASDQYVVENELNVDAQNECTEKVDVNQYVIENQSDIFVNQDEGAAVTESIVIEESEPTSEQYIVSANDNFESQYETEAHQDLSTEVKGEICIEEGNIDTENYEIAVEEETTKNREITLIKPNEKENVKKSDLTTGTDTEQEQILVEETIQEVSDPIDETMDIQTSNEADDSFENPQDNVELTSSQIVQGEDGTVVTVETYRTTDNQDPTEQTKTVVEVAPPKQRRTRKPPFEVPMHVLGVDISKPNESVPNGRPAPKPRLGVKVPYRNLTSQIVSKAEIEEEIMERSRQKQEQQQVNANFARSLTHRLAKKIAPSTDTDSESTSIRDNEEAVDDPSEMDGSREVLATESTTIENDSDLLAILEGDGEDMPVLPKEVVTSQEDETNLKALEREIALQQLQELPTQEPKPRIFRSRQFKGSQTTPEVTLSKTKSTVLEKSPQKSSHEKSPLKSNQEKSSNKNKENSSKSSASHSATDKKDPYNIDLAVSPKKGPVEVEPQVKVNMVLKTYSRKRKISDSKEFPEATPPPKKPIFEDPDVKIELDVPTPSSEVYITKSSRVIKKKVIWDPAEAQSRSFKTATKMAELKSSPVVKVTKVEKVASQDKIVEKKIEKVTTTATATPKKDKISIEKKLKNDTPKTNKSPPKVKKPRSEIDKLLMDEGAVKMLYELNNEPLNKKKKDFYSVDRAERDILKKANQLKSELQQQNSEGNQKSLRKKDSFTPSPAKPAVTLERKMSKDSTMSSVQNTPPGSPFAHSQGSMLIRRRSSSSVSSSDSVAAADDNNSDSDIFYGSKAAKKKSDVKVKKTKKVVESAKQEAQDKNEKVESPTKISKTKQYKSFTVKRIGKNISIDFNYVDEKCYFTVQVLEELTLALKRFAKDKESVSVTLASSSKAFCLGLDYISLVSEDEDERMEGAKHMTDKVRDFLMCLLHFPKILIACVQGECVGLGVTMLPLFDMVIASDKATFCTPYSKLGCMSEAGFLLSFPNFINHGLAAELLYTGQTLTADDAFRRGLVTRLCWPEKYKETLKSIVTSISQGSKQALESLKKQLRNHNIKQTEEAISSDMQTLIEHWSSDECQNNFSQLGKLH